MRLFLILLATVLLIACRADATWQQIVNAGTLRVGLDPTYPPFENADSGELVGIDVDLANAIAADLALNVQFDYIGYDGLYDALLTERVDVLISALIVDETRSADFAFSNAYFNAGQVLLTATNSPIQQLSDLAGRTVAVELGAMGHVAAIEQQTHLPDLQIVTFSTPDEVIEAVLGACDSDSCNSADAAIIDNVTAQLTLSPQLQIVDPAVTVEPFAIVVRVADRQLLNQLNRSLEKLEQSGELQAILRKNFNNAR